ncbi:hypothetical protein PRIPAC_83866 [Pristionchus pacificus]|uniref:Uncharacterized protein n=1 Tax=Pristionchus pacificus TaxID=54126 RepID=A0A2A6CCF1_PRIPA|nr:hypothetical protein PRIPAC_83866 [Pristionchus pacificus]|eukprot:PDM75809.1 hypothetical protein PRIPAC_40188 [Pristionchus pacificus]
MTRLSFLLLLAAVAVAADDGIFGQIKSYLWTDSVAGCPFGLPLKNACPGTGIFSYYTCCNGAGSDCCFRLQGWVVFIIVSLLVSLVISCVGSIISCICCCGRRD